VEYCEFLLQGWNAEGLALLVGVVIAIVIEYWPAYQSLPPKWKQLAYLGICVLLGFGTWGIALAYGCEAMANWWQVVQAIVGAFAGGTAAHTGCTRS